MKKGFLIFVYCLLPIAYCFSQDFTPPKPENTPQAKPPFWSWDKVYTGGGIGLNFGTVTFINLSPMVGYKITPAYSAGISITYIYVKDNRYSSANSLNVYGGSVFTRYLITDFLFAHAEYELLNGDWDQPYSNRRFSMNNVWVGGGLRQHSGNSSINIMVLWNLNETDYSKAYFGNPQLRIGIGIGL